MSELEIMSTGVAIVMAVLALLWALTAMIGVVIVRFGGGIAGWRDGRRKAAEAGRGTGIPPHHLVAIAAAVAEAIGAPHRIVRIAAPVHRQTDWTVRSRGGHRLPWRRGQMSTGQGPRSSRMNQR